ncbi:MAG: Rpn family recombination-promoting nuclease/putative transposase [Bacteroidales bacterium]|jgi:predicted transposase/invertase (TIGR01784 family)|nr:Rpn family recombination-promoting nuclease/putative transposase [Bacteroidales bacterium]
MRPDKFQEQKKKQQNLIRFNWALNHILLNKINFGILEGFISVLLRENLSIISIGESEINKTSPQDKFNRVDMLVQNEKNEIFIIELQISSELEYFYCMPYGVSKAVIESLNSNDDYSNKIRNIYHISIVYFDFAQEDDYVYYGHNNFYGVHNNNRLTLSEKEEKFLRINAIDIFSEYYILQVNSFNNVVKNQLDEWIYYLKNEEVLDEFTALGLSLIREKLTYNHLSEKDKKDYMHYLSIMNNVPISNC